MAEAVLHNDPDLHYLLWQCCCFRKRKSGRAVSSGVRQVVYTLLLAALFTVLLATLLVPQGSPDALRYSVWGVSFVSILVARVLWLGRSMAFSMEGEDDRYWVSKVRDAYNRCHTRDRGVCMGRVLPAIKIVAVGFGAIGLAVAAVIVSRTPSFAEDVGEGGSGKVMLATVLALFAMVASLMCCVLPSRDWKWVPGVKEVQATMTGTKVHNMDAAASGAAQGTPAAPTAGGDDPNDLNHTRMRVARQDLKSWLLVFLLTILVVSPIAWSRCVGDGCSHAPQLVIFAAALLMGAMVWRLYNLVHPQSILTWHGTGYSKPRMKHAYRVLMITAGTFFTLAMIMFILGTALENAVSDDAKSTARLGTQTPAKFGYDVSWLCVWSFGHGWGL